MDTRVKDMCRSTGVRQGRLTVRELMGEVASSVGFAGVVLVLHPAFHVGFFARADRDGGPLFLADWLPTKHTDGLLTLSLFPHGRTPSPHSGTSRHFGHRTTGRLVCL